MGPEWGFWELFWPQAVRGAAILFCMVPAVGMALRDVPDDELRDASAFNSLLRNLGGAVGIAVTNTWLIRFSAQHGAELAQSLNRIPTLGALNSLATRYGASGVPPAQAPLVAGQQLADQLSAKALTLAFDDVFRISAWVFIAAFAVVPFCCGGPMTQRAGGPMH